MAIQMSKVYRQHYDSIVEKGKASLPERYIPFLLDYAAYKTKSGRGYYQYEEILSIVMSAAVKAAKTFKEGLGDFSTYVKPFINGAIVDHYREGSKRNADIKRKILAFVSVYQYDHGKFPTEHIIMKELRLSQAAFDMALETMTRQITEVDEIICTEFTTESNIIFDSVKRIFSLFKPIEEKILTMKFIEEETDIHIASMLGLQPKQVQNTLIELLPKVRKLMEDNHITLESYYESMARRDQ